MGFILMARAKRIRSAEVKRLASRQALISHPHLIHQTVDVKTGDGIDNLAYEKDGKDLATHSKGKRNKKVGTPTLHFPRPPSTTPSTSSDSSSTYYTKKRSSSRPLNDKTPHVFKKTRSVELDPDEYAVIRRKADRKLKHKHKRKYISSENRVGSIEEKAQVHSSPSSFVDGIASDEAFELSNEKESHFYEHIEAFNPNVIAGNYHRNKLLNDESFNIQGRDDPDFGSPNEAYNREIMKVLQRDGGRLPDSLSIGSFLSMASIRSFPKCGVPEPLSRVLEPVSVTHLDQSDGPDGAAQLPRVLNVKTKKLGEKISDEKSGYFARSQSDGADPGVIGPVVWEIHKKQLEAQGELD